MAETPQKPDAGAQKADPRVGSVLSERYRLDRLLGIGGMGRVYAAEHVLMRKRLAVKVLHRELTRVPEVVARFEREAMAAANIDHPNIAAATDFGKLPDGAVFLVLEYVSGRSLRDEIAAGPMPPVRALHISGQIASTLAAAHALNIVHRDLKPENVMLVEKGSDRDFVKVLDFGIAKVPFDEISERGSVRPGQKITKAGMVFGTPEYMAPEQALGQQVDGRADLYALGVILFEMLAGVRPYNSATQVGILGQQLSLPVPRVADRAPGVAVPPQLEHVLQTLLARDASERYASASEVVALLEQLPGAAPTHSRQLFTLPRGSELLPSGSASQDSVLLEKAAHMADGPDRPKVLNDSQASDPGRVAASRHSVPPAHVPPRPGPPSEKPAASPPPVSASRPPLRASRPPPPPSRAPLSASRPPLSASRPPLSASRPPLSASRPPPPPSSRKRQPAPPEATRDDAGGAGPPEAQSPVLIVPAPAAIAPVPSPNVDAPDISAAATAIEVLDKEPLPLVVPAVSDKEPLPLIAPAVPPSPAEAAPTAPAALDEPYDIPLRPSLGQLLRRMTRAPIGAWKAMRARRSGSAMLELERALATVSPSRTTEPGRAGEAVRSALSGVPLPAVVVGLVLFVTVSIGGVLFLSGRWSASRTSERPADAQASPRHETVAKKPGSAQSGPAAVVTPPKSAPQPDELARARDSGTTALRALSAQYPRDGRTALELAKSLRRDELFSDVTEALARALSVDHTLNTSGEVATLLWQATQKSESRAQAFALLEQSMGTRGSDIAYDLATTEGIQPAVKERAEQMLHGNGFEQHASEALRIAVALRGARGCKAQRELIERAEKSGDRRSLPYLEAIRKGCPAGGEQRVRAAIKAIQRRTRG